MSEITKEILDNDWVCSGYEEDTPGELDYYIQEGSVEPGDTAYVYIQEANEIRELEIIHTIVRSDAPSEYDSYDEDVLLDGEDKYNSDFSCEVITDEDCYLIWFKDNGEV